ncbi:GspE/PulE family protein [Polaribacter sp. Asnod6-C07]|uniref:GspE/PulE family protein n=1 Tax=Polaribacter sp. Asnod6-C07 TaxID=3160582 RepID=UPI00386C3414
MEIQQYEISTILTQLISSDQAYHYRIIPIEEVDNLWIFKTDSVQKEILSQELAIVFGKEIKLEIVDSDKIQRYLEINYRKRERISQQKSLHYSEDFLMNIIYEAKEIGSSDIHFEIFEKQARVRLRIDGKLIERYVISLDEYPKIINRIKIMSSLDISEKRLPQDGRINLRTSQEDFDIRVSSLPTLYGEKLVLRILSKNNILFSLDNLGFTDEEIKTYITAVQKPSGIILISGPTGSGKTTTLYATLKLLNSNDANILTIEDPIEYTLEGVNQVQLKQNIGLDFASTLRTFLRQDPDIIMVGEIRDVDTANMAIRASLTGHLVLSTIHTNSAWATVSRLIDMGIPSFLIASTLNVSVAQRLVRKLCNNCKRSQADVNLNLDAVQELSKIDFHYEAVGCPSCYQTGYQGRKAVYEIIPITEELVKSIENKNVEIYDYLKKNNIATLKSNMIALVKQGITSIEEVYPFLIS